MTVADKWLPGQPLRESDFVRFTSKILIAADSCHYWLGKLDSGYGRFWCQGRTLLAHRVSWEHINGPVPEKLQLDHLCRNRGCVNPEHLEPVTLGTNVLRGNGITAMNHRKTHCTNGHNLTNAYIDKRGHRYCRPCALSRTTQWRMARAL